jgi:4-alpha-glucanotransferase
MTRTDIHHALGLHMHQPPGNLRLLIEANPWEAEEIIRCYERVPRYALQYRDVARLHVGFSGILLEQLRDPDIVDRYRHIVDIPEMLERYREADNIELIGMGYSHPIFPLIPRADWAEQLTRGRALMEQTFGRAPRGFWPPEMAFTMTMIPALVQAGYEYVVVDGVHVRPEDGINDIFRPYIACHEGVCINVVPRDRDVSNAQESGLNPQWFRNEVLWRIGGSARPEEKRLVTTWSDGENGGWFRQTCEPSGFFGHFFAPYMEEVRSGSWPITPVRLGDYLHRVTPSAHTQVQTGAWNVGSTSGEDLSQWAGSARQLEAVAEVERLSARYWQLVQRCPTGVGKGQGADAIARARRLILEAETSCFLFLGDSWIPHLHARTRDADMALDEAEVMLSGPSPAESYGFDPDGLAE